MNERELRADALRRLNGIPKADLLATLEQQCSASLLDDLAFSASRRYGKQEFERIDAEITGLINRTKELANKPGLEAHRELLECHAKITRLWRRDDRICNLIGLKANKQTT